jgi:HD-like signal output (HDOD) protein
MSAANSLLNRELRGYGMDPRTAWRHSLAAALSARRIAEIRYPEMREDAFVVGLLHDAGKIILDPFLEKSREALAALCPKGEPVTPAVEKELLGFDHTEIMARACRFWRFPEAVVQAVRYHHHPAHASGSRLAFVAHLANVAAHRAGLGYPKMEVDSLQAEGTLDALDFQEGDVEELAADALREVEKLESGLQTD